MTCIVSKNEQKSSGTLLKETLAISKYTVTVLTGGNKRAQSYCFPNNMKGKSGADFAQILRMWGFDCGY